MLYNFPDKVVQQNDLVTLYDNKLSETELGNNTSNDSIDLVHDKSLAHALVFITLLTLIYTDCDMLINYL